MSSYSPPFSLWFIQSQLINYFSKPTYGGGGQILEQNEKIFENSWAGTCPLPSPHSPEGSKLSRGAAILRAGEGGGGGGRGMSLQILVHIARVQLLSLTLNNFFILIGNTVPSPGRVYLLIPHHELITYYLLYLNLNFISPPIFVKVRII